ncbi:aspartate carbamoyltransferase catalytic subunit [Gracilibacillus oryzae]|uniref:Aspartate carbamoyltransferase n=1 Tax=Gracilibacillus oryzae TaxID=1672701 RepID=A0A7C8L088_9BACI|nr:aspartate carbamoyltransferase catalytic subunit [Gracilibacillus oryzae]KAB8138675.1 aspartate carbamoyltransferase catalytic subunit [Gracilibacillus oryzae]
MKHFVSMQDLSEQEMYKLIKKADQISRGGARPLNRQYFAANLFFEPSTRTKMSFVVAQRRLGIEVLDFMAEVSSVTKGESIYDTARTFESIGADLIVLRHQEENIARKLADAIQTPVINAGDGTGEHPTQSLLDLVTIYQEFEQFKGLKVVIAGDIKHSRVARSNAIALSTLGCEIYLTGMETWQDSSLRFPYISMDEAVEMADVLMLLRIQHERHQDHLAFDQNSYLQTYGLTIERERKMKKHAVILHPAPVNRGVEIDSSLVECERSRIFKQMKNGVAARMAVIQTLLNQGGNYNEEDFNQRHAFIG